MRISELLDIRAIDVNASVGSKAEAIDYMTHLMEESGNLYDREAYKKGVLAREEEGTESGKELQYRIQNARQ